MSVSEIGRDIAGKKPPREEVTEIDDARGKMLIEKISKYLHASLISGVQLPEIYSYQRVPLIGTNHQTVVLNVGDGKILSLCLIETQGEKPL